nr:hypothetical protein [Deltaproteobacteria bacterium]
MATTPVTAEGRRCRSATRAPTTGRGLVVVRRGGRAARRPHAAHLDGNTVDALGLSPTVLRVSFRTGDDFPRLALTYPHATSVFGSNGGTDATHQTDRTPAPTAPT